MSKSSILQPSILKPQPGVPGLQPTPSQVFGVPNLDSDIPKAKKGSDFLTDQIVKIMFFGDIGTGKSQAEVFLLNAGYKVLRIEADFGSSGEDETILNQVDPEILKANERVWTPEKIKHLEAFMENPELAIPDIYTWDPDFLFLNGLSAHQNLIENDEFTKMADNNTQAAWGRIKKRTMNPLFDFLRLYNTKTGRNWSKITTVLETEKASEYRYTQNKDGEVQQKPVLGTEKAGPMLATSVRKIAGAGFGLVIQTEKRQVGMSAPEYLYVTSGHALMTKQRAYGLPPTIKPETFWNDYIFTRVSPTGTEVLKSAASSSEVSASK